MIRLFVSVLAVLIVAIIAYALVRLIERGINAYVLWRERREQAKANVLREILHASTDPLQRDIIIDQILKERAA